MGARIARFLEQGRWVIFERDPQGRVRTYSHAEGDSNVRLLTQWFEEGRYQSF